MKQCGVRLCRPTVSITEIGPPPRALRAALGDAPLAPPVGFAEIGPPLRTLVAPLHVTSLDVGANRR